MNGASNALTRSGSVPSLDLKSFLPSNTEDEQIVDTTHQVITILYITYVFCKYFLYIQHIYKEYKRGFIIYLVLQSEYWEWKQYMESCVLLLQVAANIFTNISSELVLHEVLNSVQGYNFLCSK